MSQPEAFPHNPEADSFQFAATWQLLKRATLGHIWFVVATTVLSIALVSAYLAVWPATWQAEVMVAADSEKDMSRTAFYQGWNIFRREGLTDEGTLMRTPPVLREVAQRLNLTYEDMYHPFTSYVTYLWGESWLGKNYRKVKAWLLGTPPSTLTEEELAFYRVMADFSAGVSVRQVGDASIGLLVVNGSNQRVAEIANSIVEVYFEKRRERYVAEAEQSYNSLRQEADKVRAALSELESAQRRFRSESGSVLLFEQERVQIGQLQVLRAAITELRAQISEGSSALAVLDGQMRNDAERLRSDRVFRDEALKDRLPKLEALLAAAREQYQPDAPEVRDLVRQIAAANAELADASGPSIVRNTGRVGDSYETLRARRQALEATLAGQEASLKIRQAEFDRMSGVLGDVPRKMQVNQEFERQQRILDATYAGLNDKLTQAAVSMATARSAPPAMRVVEPARVPEKPVWPNTKLMIAIALGVGLFVGVMGALLLELVHLRVNRYRLEALPEQFRLFAIVDRDDDFIETLYPSRGSAGAART